MWGKASREMGNFADNPRDMRNALCWLILATIIGGTAMAGGFGMAISPMLGGWIYDTTGSYGWLFLGSFGIGLGAVAIALTFRPFPEKKLRTVPSAA